MEHRNVVELEKSGQALREPPPRTPMSHRDRLSRWAAVLDAAPYRQLSSLHRTEYRDPALRERMRADDSPLFLAYRDPVLRAEGLSDDTYGTARRFFGLSEGQLHHIVCSCHCGETLLARHVACRVRSVMPKRQLGEVVASLFRRR